ncbi:glycosyltransferase [Weissella muntiaci]|uniref:Glycosyltransferase n=1 Tax=Weissella muntiaci TaxID=2508881 RepID=A0A6C2C774_9LACO|nr:glycosyltransferase [Weissella muntiaci]TYC49871.1 glycosyltransferase [Weissella muntiaci]
MMRIKNKILVVGPDMAESGGVATVMQHFADQQANLTDFDIQLLVTWRQRWIWNFIKVVLRYRILLHRRNIDLVHIHVSERGSFWRAAIITWLTPRRIPVIHHYHAAEFDVFYKSQGRLFKWIIRKTIDRASQVIVLSQSWLTFFTALTKTDILIIHNGVPIPNEQLQVNETSKKVVTFGRIGKRKGTYDLVRVAKQVHQLDANITFDVYGDGTTTDLENVQNQIKLAGMAEVIRLHDWVDDVYEPMQDAMLHFLPSYHEGLPMAILESMAYGLPNLATRIGGIPELIDGRSNGYLVDAGSIEQMTKLIYKYAQMGIDEKLITSNLARQTIIEQYSLGKMFEQVTKLYERILR